MTTQLNLVDIQFGDKYDAEKARRLVEQIKRLTRTLNDLINQVSGLSGGVSTPVTHHVIATTAGLGPDHTTSGLESGLVLKATGVNDAAFRRLQFPELARTDPLSFESPGQGDVLLFWDGYYSMRPSTDVIGVSDPGDDAILSWSAASDGFAWRTGAHGINIGLGSITVDETELNHNSLLGLATGDPHTQYPLAAGVETISGAWTFTAATVFDDTATFNDDTYLAGYGPIEYKSATGASVDAGKWGIEYTGDSMRIFSLDDGDVDCEDAIEIFRDGSVIDEVAISGRRATFNGEALLVQSNAAEIELQTFFMAGA